jgi:hypothetical protein
MKKELKTVSLSKNHVLLGEIPTRHTLFLKSMARLCTQMLPSENLRALIVANLLQRDIQHKSIAPMSATMPITTKDIYQKCVPFAGRDSQSNGIVTKKSELVVTNVAGNSVEKRVYNLSVEQAHLFYANGILSSNSSGEDHVGDEAALLFMARPISKIPEKERPLVYPKTITEVKNLELKEIYAEIEKSTQMETAVYGW